MISGIGIFCLLSWSVPQTCAAQAQCPHTRACNVRIYYRWNSADIDPSFCGNSASLDSIAGQMKHLLADPSVRDVRIKVTSFASLEGNSTYNAGLSRRRTEAIVHYLTQDARIDRSRITVADSVYDWKTLEHHRRDIPGDALSEAMEVLVEQNGPASQVQREARAKQSIVRSEGGKAYRYIQRHYAPQMRNSSVSWSYSLLPAAPAVTADTVQQPLPEPEPAQTDVQQEATAPAPPHRRNFYMAVKTNLLYDAVAIPNVGVEFYLGKNWSAAADWMYAWWKDDRKHRYWRVYGGDVEIRRWFGRRAAEKPLTGHHLGVYGQMLTYDFEWGGKGSLGPKWTYGGGIKYGYAQPIGRRLNLDFSLGLGYLHGRYMVYDKPACDRRNCYPWKQTKQRNWFGPTQAEVSLVWLIGHGNRNKRKGGE